MMSNKKALIEALKEMGRVVILAIIPILIDSLSKGMVDWNVILIAGIIALLRFIDKWLHNLEPEGISGGLVRF